MWTADDRIIFANGDGIFRVLASGGVPEPLVPLNEGEAVLRPQLLPDGEHLLFTLATGRATNRWDAAVIVIQSLTTGERDVVVTGGADGRYVDSGHLIYAVGTDIVATAFDVRARQVRGAPVVIQRGIRRASAATTGAAHFAISALGDLAYLPDAPVQNLLTFIDPTTRARSSAGAFQSSMYPRVSPDGNQVAVVEGFDALETWIHSLTPGVAPQKFEGLSPAWPPDGSRVAYRSPGQGLWLRRVDGNGRAERLAAGDSPFPIGWTDGGTTLIFSDSDKIWLQRAGADPVALWDVAWSGSLSPDGEWVAFYRTENGVNLAYVGSVRDPARRYQVSKQGGHHPVWSRDGTMLYYAANSTGPIAALMAVDVRTRPSVTFGEPALIVEEINQPLNQERHYDVMPDGRLLVSMPDARRSTRSGEITVVLNWVEELKRLVPVN